MDIIKDNENIWNACKHASFPYDQSYNNIISLIVKFIRYFYQYQVPYKRNNKM